jgi:pimeloyl-ACP methyl ester carboxylesterase
MTAFDSIEWFVNVRQYVGSKSESSGILSIDYPGYGNNEGNPSPHSIQESIDKALRKAIDHIRSTAGASVSDLIVLGHSIGSGVATSWLSSKPVDIAPISKLILSAPFTSIVDMGSHIFGVPRWLVSLICRHNWDNKVALRAVLRSDVSIYIVHGELDEIVPFTMGKELADIDKNRIQFVPIGHMHHNDILGMFKTYAKIISASPTSPDVSSVVTD